MLVAVLAACLALSLAGTAIRGLDATADTGEGQLISALYDPPASRVERALVQGDGQLFATHATDPFLRRPDLIRGGAEEQAYRFQRPLYGWLGWLASAGQPGAVPVAMVALTVVSVVALVTGAAWVLARRGAQPALALVLLLTPGVLADLDRVGPEALGALLVLAGALLWQQEDRSRGAWAVLCLGTAGLLRETLLIVPVVLAAVDLLRGRPPMRSLVRAGLAGAPYVVWVLVLRAVLGAWPRGVVSGRISVVPFGGLVDGVSSWTAADVAVAVAVLGSAVVAVVRTEEAWLRGLIGGHLVLAATLGEPVWVSSLDWGRVLLPMTVFALVALARRRPSAPEGAPAHGAGAGEAPVLSSEGPT